MYSENENDGVVWGGVPNGFLLSGLTLYLLQQQYSLVVKINKENKIEGSSCSDCHHFRTVPTAVMQDLLLELAV